MMFNKNSIWNMKLVTYALWKYQIFLLILFWCIKLCQTFRTPNFGICALLKYQTQTLMPFWCITFWHFTLLKYQTLYQTLPLKPFRNIKLCHLPPFGIKLCYLRPFETPNFDTYDFVVYQNDFLKPLFRIYKVKILHRIDSGGVY